MGIIRSSGCLSVLLNYAVVIANLDHGSGWLISGLFQDDELILWAENVFAFVLCFAEPGGLKWTFKWCCFTLRICVLLSGSRRTRFLTGGICRCAAACFYADTIFPIAVANTLMKHSAAFGFQVSSSNMVHQYSTGCSRKNKIASLKTVAARNPREQNG
jgi:hypothetical protein